MSPFSFRTSRRVALGTSILCTLILIYYSYQNPQSAFRSIPKQLQFTYWKPIPPIPPPKTLSWPTDLKSPEAVKYLHDVHTKFNATINHRKTGNILGNYTLKAYREKLWEYHQKYMIPQKSSSIPSSSSSMESQGSKESQDPTMLPEYISLIKARLSLDRPNMTLPKVPKRVYTTDKEQVPNQPHFWKWNQMMPDWKMEVFTDDKMDDWVEENLEGTRAKEIWAELDRAVLKSDVLRLLLMLLQGGIYADSDTYPKLPGEQWGKPYKTVTHPALTFPRLNPEDQSEEQDDPPSLIVSLEFDALGVEDTDFREKHLSRAEQITQWGFMASPGHPVFLDTIGRIFEITEDLLRRKKIKGDEWDPKIDEPQTMEWTGPAMFSDSVYRYLLARYGFHPESIAGIIQPVKIGDVVILPSMCFSGREHTYLALWHGFSHRWQIDDPREREGVLKDLDKNRKGG